MSRHVVATTAEIAPGTCKIVTVKGREIGVFHVGTDVGLAVHVASVKVPAVHVAADAMRAERDIHVEITSRGCRRGKREHTRENEEPMEERHAITYYGIS